jgi:hypothetical protein
VEELTVGKAIREELKRDREGTPQYQILTSQRYLFEEGKKFTYNPFYGKDREYIKENWEEANKVYKTIYEMFIAIWFFENSNDMIPDHYVPKPIWENLEV